MLNHAARQWLIKESELRAQQLGIDTPERKKQREKDDPSLSSSYQCPFLI